MAMFSTVLSIPFDWGDVLHAVNERCTKLTCDLCKRYTL